MPILRGEALRFRLEQIAEHTDENGVTDPFIYNELDGRRKVLEAYSGALDLLDAFEWAEKMTQDGGGDMDGPRMILELTATVVDMLTNGTHKHQAWYPMSLRKQILEGGLDEVASDPSITAEELNDALVYLRPIMSCGKPS